MNKIGTQICVLGGGPAGATAARRLAILGHSVVLVEKKQFPRPHVGESLQGGILPLLDVLNLRCEVEHGGFLRTTTAQIKWASGVEVREAPGVPGFQVDRPRFDQILLNGAANAGVHVIQPARVTAIETCPQQGHTIVARHPNGDTIRILCDFLVDATGRASITGGKRVMGVPSIAMYAYFNDSGIQGTETLVEAGESSWYWGAPLPSGLFNATVFIENRDFKRGVTKAGSIERYYRDLIGSSELLSCCLAGTRAGRVEVCDATCGWSEAPIEHNVLKCGEASFTIDPLSSQGVQTAIGSALHAAAVIHTILERPADADLARAFYLERSRRSVSFHADASGQVYADAAVRFQTHFWLQRSITILPRAETDHMRRSERKPGALLRIHPSVTLTDTAVILGSFVTAAKAVTTPDLGEPIAFLDGVRLAPLIEMLDKPMRVDEVLRLWAGLVTPQRAGRILDLVLRRHILYGVNQEGT